VSPSAAKPHLYIGVWTPKPEKRSLTPRLDLCGPSAPEFIPNAENILSAAGDLAEGVLFPGAVITDKASLVPRSNLDALAGADLYGLVGPREAGGLGLEMGPTAWRVIETLAGGCLATTFVWMQHHTAVTTVAGASAETRDRWLFPLCRGERRAGIALGGVLPGDPRLTITEASDGLILDGTSPWVTGWGLIDVLLVAARRGDELMWIMVDAAESETMTVDRLALVACNASATVSLTFRHHRVGKDRVVGMMPFAAWPERDANSLRTNGALALGVASRCCRMIGPGPLDDQLDAARSRLHTARTAEIPTARAAAAELAWRAAGALLVSQGSGSIIVDQHAQRLAREAMFILLFGTRPAIKQSLLASLTRAPAES
jgi:alkylation response protein AidB-like acyl-CoA dehydrogenase